MSNPLVALASSVGDYIKDIMGSKSTLPKPRILSSAVTISIIAGDKEIDLGEIDSFSKQKQFTQIKKWKPFGSKYEKLLIDDEGWSLTFSGGKVNWNLGYVIYLQEKLLTGMNNSNFPDTSNTALNIGTILNKPMFKIRHTTNHYDGTVEAYEYCNVTILDYTQDNNEDNTQLPEKFTAFSEYREILRNSLIENTSDYSKINSAIVQIMKSQN